MLVNLQHILDQINRPIVNDGNQADFSLNMGLRAKLNTALAEKGFQLGKFTSTFARSSDNISIFPNQYLLFAAEIHALATELKRYLECFDAVRDKASLLVGNTAHIQNAIQSDAELSPLFTSVTDINLFAAFIANDSRVSRLGAKNLINEQGQPRPSSDCFSSVVLKVVNMPDVSSAVFGDLVYALTEVPDLYDELKAWLDNQATVPTDLAEQAFLPKPFILLAGLSGTGKTRFVREQAEKDLSNYQLVAVRPDWHEPSDLLGYISRLGGSGPNFVVTDTLKFIVKAWKAAVSPEAAGEGTLRPLDQIFPYWLCLDEMNLAPVEQYFADYLSVLETRKWDSGEYSCDPLISLDAILAQLGVNGMQTLREHLDLVGDELWDYFCAEGIPLPPNLIVAGTVNMDETTHGFSRKVIDRAYTIDFGEFFPNNYSEYFSPSTEPVKLGFPRISHPAQSDLGTATADQDGSRSIAFLDAVNSVLKDTPFELAYRALNELFLALVCFTPETDESLKAVWDDFLMSKVLPRIDGDSDKLSAKNDDADNLLAELQAVLEAQFGDLWNEERPDLLRKNVDGSPLSVAFRSSKKLDWMIRRLENSGFTSFWQ